jgi:hypothetical protein
VDDVHGAEDFTLFYYLSRVYQDRYVFIFV